MSEKSMRKDLTEGSVPKLLLTFAAPLFVSNALQAVYNIVDMIVVGQVIGGSGMSAVSTGGNILKSIMTDKKNWIDKDGKKIEGNKLPDWEKLKPPAGLIKDGKEDKANKLQWDKLRDYLGH